jgi:hypothetical protein
MSLQFKVEVIFRSPVRNLLEILRACPVLPKSVLWNLEIPVH